MPGFTQSEHDGDRLVRRSGMIDQLTGAHYMQGKLFLSALLLSCSAMAEQSQLDQHAVCPEPVEGTYRVLFIGDSITRHGFDDYTISELGWSHIAGMAASSAATDYPSVLAGKISKDRNQQVVKCFHTYGGSGSVTDRLAGMPTVVNTKPDLVVLQLGEHDDATTDSAKFRRQYADLVHQVRAMSSKPKVIAVGPWSPGKLNAEGEYKDSTAHVDRAMREVAAEESLQYRSVSDIATRPNTHGWGTSPGVKWHPNDYGHSLYAQKIFEMYKQN